MTTRTPDTSPTRPPGLDLSQTPRVGFATLVGVEVRKSVDTRAGRWYVGSIAALVLLVTLAIALLFTADPGTQSYAGFLGFLGVVLGFFLPVIPILLVTSEWSQRTGLVTFVLEPRRWRVVLAKLLAGVVLVVVLFAVAFVVAALGVVLAIPRGVDPDWSLSYPQVQGVVLADLIRVFVAFGFAMLLRNSPAAIVAYFFYALVLPFLVGVIGFYLSWFGDLAPWIELNQAQGPLYEGDAVPDAGQWARLGTASLIWLWGPLALGTWRLLRAEVK